MNTVRTIAIYARVSTEEQAEEGFSIRAQLETLRGYAHQHQYIIHDEYVDEGISGKSIEKRLQLQRLLRDAKAGLFNEVIVWKINRMSRNQLDLLKIVDELTKCSVSFRSFSENFETETPMGRFALQMMGSVAELERNTIVENVKLGMKQRAKQGKWNGGTVLGYKTVEVANSVQRKHKETRLEIVESEAAIVRLIFERYAGGQGFKSIANELNHLGYKSKHGRPFDITSIKRIVTNPVYAGKIRFNKQTDWATKRRAGTNPNPIVVDGEHEAIVSQELWDRAQGVYSMRSKKSPRVFDGSFPFTGVIRCPQCGAGMVAQRATRKLKSGEIKYTRYYQCGQFANKGSAVCRSNGIRADYAEQEILAYIERLVNNPKLILDVTHGVNQKRAGVSKPLKQELNHLITELANVQRKIDKYFKLYEDDMLPPQELKNRVAELSETQRRLTERKSEIENTLGKSDASRVDIAAVQSMLHGFRTLFEKQPFERKKHLIHTLIKRVTITPDRTIDKIDFRLSEISTKF